MPVARCMSIERATSGAVTRQDLRPYDWQDIWPELENATSSPGIAPTEAPLDRRQHNNPPPPDLERREPIAAKLANQGVTHV